MESTNPHLKNAPIKEALIDIQSVLPSSFSVGTLKTSFLEKVSSRGFSSAHEINQIEIQGGKAQDNLFSSSKETLIGYRFNNKDNTKVIQVRSNGFTFSHLQPYSNWEDFLQEAKDFWTIYVELAQPERHTRVATRFINVIELVESVDTISSLNNYFSNSPSIPKGLPEALEHCFSRFVVNDDQKQLKAIITQAFEKLPEGKKHIVLDIDVFKELAVGVDNDTIWSVLADLRSLKNDIFFKILAEKVIKRFK